MLSVSPARVALHAELAALADAFFATQEPVEAVEAVEVSEPAVMMCDGSKGWATRYLGAPKRLVANLKGECGPYFAAYVANALRRGWTNSCTSFHFPLSVSPSGEVYGAAQRYRSGPDLPANHLA